MSAIEQELLHFLLPQLEQIGFEVLELQYRREHGSWVLRLFVDRLDEQNVSLEDCSRVTRFCEDWLETDDLIRGHYNLEVSSPGINRQLKTARHFQRFNGQHAKIALTDSLFTDRVQKNFTGTLQGFIEGKVIIDDVVAGKVEIPLEKIVKAHLGIA